MTENRDLPAPATAPSWSGRSRDRQTSVTRRSDEAFEQRMQRGWEELKVLGWGMRTSRLRALSLALVHQAVTAPDRWAETLRAGPAHRAAMLLSEHTGPDLPTAHLVLAKALGATADSGRLARVISVVDAMVTGPGAPAGPTAAAPIVARH